MRWLSTWFARLSIRGSLLLGFAVVVVFMAVSLFTALSGINRMSLATQQIVFDKLPETVQILQVARATDSLVAASGPLVSLARQSEFQAAFGLVETAQASLKRALSELLESSIDVEDVTRLTERLNDNLEQLRTLTAERVALIDTIELIRQRLIENQQALLRHLTYRVRILDSDGDILRKLLAAPSPAVEKIASLAAGAAPLLPVARFYAELESIHTRLLAAAQETSQPALALSREILVSDFYLADQTLNKMPGDIVRATASAFEELKVLALSDQGLIAHRHEELSRVAAIRMLIEANQRISNAVDLATRDLVANGMGSIHLAAARADDMRRRFTYSLTVIAAFSIVVISVFFVFYVDRHLSRRLSNLSKVMQAIAVGRYETPLPPAGPDELGRLGAAVRQFHKTAREAASREATLRDSKTEVETARTALEHKARELEAANRKLSDLSVSDGLTGIANRRRFDDALTEEWARAQRTGNVLALVMLDVDFFKQYNDHYGHQGGDDCLRRIAGVLRDSARRAGDLPARYGGEEFCVILPNTGLAAAFDFAESLRGKIGELGLEYTRSPFGHVTVSLGIAAMAPVEGSQPRDLMRRADEALYRSKREGRNRTLPRPETVGMNPIDQANPEDPGQD